MPTFCFTLANTVVTHATQGPCGPWVLVELPENLYVSRIFQFLAPLMLAEPAENLGDSRTSGSRTHNGFLRNL